MSKVKGLIKQAVGDLTGDIVMAREGRIERSGQAVLDHPQTDGQKVQRIMDAPHGDWVHGGTHQGNAGNRGWFGISKRK